MKKVCIALTLILSILTYAHTELQFHSESCQDKYVYHTFFEGKHNGVFVEIGAYDGIFASNSLFFERLGWKGVCIEPLPHVFEKLKQNRSCICVHGCISDFTGPAQFVIAGIMSGLLEKMDERHKKRINGIESKQIIPINCYRFNDLMAQHHITHVNFMSIDIEGGELDVLKTIDFDRITIDVITVESNYEDLREQVITFMEGKGYIWMKRLGMDDIFCRRQLCN